ncbi:N-6 DNA methylase [Candidatus Woesearchaeota archaeon]|nr:N-6 DNA methylase [Candidatus Woesearchaeota archaeon]USN44930.1 MAG: N-6 DNA methylase [Candidatus Woesearchaeota archaeon]
MLDNDLKSKINKLWDKFWSGGISNPLQAIEQISYLIYMKKLEDEDLKREHNAMLKSKEFESMFKDKEDFRWSKWSHYPAEKILTHVRDNVFPFLRTLGEEGSFYNEYMKDAVFMIPTPGLLIEAIRLIDQMHIKEQNRDTKGDIYEYLLSELTTSGKNGQFRTPRHIIRMMAEILDPQIGEKVCDPACGTSGFLIATLEHIMKENTSKDLIKIDEDGNETNFVGDKISEEQWKLLQDDTINGFDIDNTMVRISLMNLMMHGIENPGIKHISTLSKRFEQTEKYDVILANPPFKGSVDESEMNESLTIRTKKTELLFIELIYNILKVGGRAAVIVPDGVLFGNSNAHKQIRELIINNCSLEAVISMPSGVFKPYAGVSTGILIFNKGNKTDKVLFYDMQSDGYTLDDKRTKIDGKGDIPDIIEKIKTKDDNNFIDRSKKCFYIPIKEIKENDYVLSISNYKKENIEEVDYEDSEKIKETIITNEEKIIEIIKKL